MKHWILEGKVQEGRANVPPSHPAHLMGPLKSSVTTTLQQPILRLLSLASEWLQAADLSKGEKKKRSKETRELDLLALKTFVGWVAKITCQAPLP